VSDIVPRKTLEAQHAALKKAEKVLATKAEERLGAFYTSVKESLQGEPPVAYSSPELADAYQAGMHQGVAKVFTELDNIGAVITDHDEATLNVQLDDNDDLDFLSLSESWATFINT
jgi:hypothetical protein